MRFRKAATFKGLPERADVIEVGLHRLLVAALALPRLLLETLQLLRRVVQLREPVRHLHPHDVKLEPFGDGRVVGRSFGERRDGFGKVRDERRLYQFGLGRLLEHLYQPARASLVAAEILNVCGPTCGDGLPHGKPTL